MCGAKRGETLALSLHLIFLTHSFVPHWLAGVFVCGEVSARYLQLRAFHTICHLRGFFLLQLTILHILC